MDFVENWGTQLSKVVVRARATQEVTPTYTECRIDGVQLQHGGLVDVCVLFTTREFV